MDSACLLARLRRNYCTDLYQNFIVRGTWCNTEMGVVAAVIFSFRFHISYFPVGYRLTISYLTKHENQIVFHTV